MKKVVGMTEYKGTVIIATTKGVYRIDDRRGLVSIPFTHDEKESKDKRIGWVNVYVDHKAGTTNCSHVIWASEQQALNRRSTSEREYLDTVKIEWEESII